MNKPKQNPKKQPLIVAVSGGFDPVHVGHVRMVNEAKKLAGKDGKLVLILNNDNWLKAKKGFVFMDEQERKEIMQSLKNVDEVVITKHKKNPNDMSVCDALRQIKPHIFANGGDRTKKNIPELDLGLEWGMKMAFGVGKGGKVQSSSWLVQKVKEK
jgi:cytidyltransferase-like protein